MNKKNVVSHRMEVARAVRPGTGVQAVRKGRKINRMGIFSVDVQVARAEARARFASVPRVLVDTGSEMTWIQADILRPLKIEVRKKDQPFVMANGQQVTRDVGYAILRCNGFETVDEVVFAQPGDLQLLGARTLEGFNAVVDARRKRLVAAGPMPVAPGRQTERGPS